MNDTKRLEFLLSMFVPTGAHVPTRNPEDDYRHVMTIWTQGKRKVTRADIDKLCLAETRR